MPELPEVETTKTSLFPLLNQKVLSVEVRNPSLRWPIPDDVQKLVGQRLIGLNRRSKYILAKFEQDQMLWHLGMSGSFRLTEPNDELRKHDHLIFNLKISNYVTMTLAVSVVFFGLIPRLKANS